MIEINLLPWKQELRWYTKRSYQGIILLTVSLIIGLLLWMYAKHSLNENDPIPHPRLNTPKQLKKDHSFIERLKWVGYLKQRQTFLGFFLTPEGNIFDVQCGTVMGTAKVRMISVDSDRCLIELQDDQQILKYSFSNENLSI